MPSKKKMKPIPEYLQESPLFLKETTEGVDLLKTLFEDLELHCADCDGKGGCGCGKDQERQETDSLLKGN